MPKRGQTLPYRVRFEWPAADGGKPVAGTTPYGSLEEASWRARRQAAVIGPTGNRCTVTVTHRDRPDEVLLELTPPPADEDDEDGE